MGESRITPSGIINDAVSMIGKMNDSSFPIDVFPNKIRNIILNMYEYLAFPIDYTACSMMTKRDGISSVSYIWLSSEGRVLIKAIL